MMGNAHIKTTLWLGSDDGDPDGMNGYGFQVSTEDHMVSIETTLEGPDDRGQELQVLIHRDLFPVIRKAMAQIDKRFR